ncbi:MAG: FISUMP domain-containing protein, partial [Bacteroidota bacterium]
TSRDGKPVTLRGGIPSGGVYSVPGVASGKFYPGLLQVCVDTTSITYTYTSLSGCKDSASQTIHVQPAQPFVCGNNFTDIRDNHSYPTVKIGSQCWFSKNLDYGLFTSAIQVQRDNCIAEKYCYSDNPVNCTLLGALYQWDEMMVFDPIEEGQGFCPPGWHIPSENEWNTLFKNYQHAAFAGDSLRVGGISGFNALLTGTSYSFQHWNFKDVATFFWSSTPHGSTEAWAHGIHLENHGVSTYPSSRSNGFSVRCTKD